MPDKPQLVTGRELARILGFQAPSYVAKLKKLGILSECYVQQPGRKHPLIDVEVAVREIEASKDPEKGYVRARWETYRRGESAAQPAEQNTTQPGRADDGAEPGTGGPAKEGEGSGSADSNPAGGPEASEDPDVISFQQAKTQKEIYAAKQAELEYRKRAGEVVEKRRVQQTASQCATIIRNGLKQIPDRQAQVFASMTDAVRIHELLNQEIDDVLHALSEQIERDVSARPTGTG